MNAYAWAELRADLGQDLDAYLGFASEYGARRGGVLRRVSAALTPSGFACVVHRGAHYAWTRGWTSASCALAWMNLFCTRVSITPASRIGGGLYIPHPSTGIVFHGHAGRNLRLFAGSAVAAELTPLHGGPLEGAPRLGDDVSVGAKAFVRGDVAIGSRVRVGFNAFVDRDLPDDCLVVSESQRPRAAPRARGTPRPA